MAVTIKDVAKLADVSVSTVSLVINKKKHISEGTRKRVFEAVKELNYYPRRSARGLPLKRCGNIGFILTDDHFSKSEPFYTKIFIGTELEARNYRNYILLTTVPRDFESDKDIPLFLLEKNVDGVIIAGWVPDDLISLIHNRNVPCVLIDYHPKNGKYVSVLVDNIRGGIEATEFLIKNGHRDIGFLGGDIQHPSIADRYQGYTNALVKNNIKINKDWTFIQDYTSQEDGFSAVKKILKLEKKPTAIFAANDALAIGCIRGLRRNGIKVPDEISFIGFDDIEESYQLEPPLTTMRVEKEELGSLGVRKIIKMIAADITCEKIKNREIINSAVKLIERKSVKKIVYKLINVKS